MEQNKKIKLLAGTDSFCTEHSQNAYRILDGKALVYIVQLDKKEKKANLGILVGEFATGEMLPSFCFQDEKYQEWRFVIKSASGDLKLEIWENACTQPLKRNFLKKTGKISEQTMQAENFQFEACLTELYYREEVKNKVFIERGTKSYSELEHQKADVIESAVHEKETDFAEQNELYRVLKWACKKQNISLAAAEKIELVCGENPSVPDIAGLSGFICRNVVLDKKWYTSDCGIIISEIDGRSVACIPKSSSYLIYGSGFQGQKMTSKIAAQIYPKAFWIGKALPAEKITVKKLIRFCMDSIRKEDIAVTFILGLIGALIGILLPTINQKIYDEYIPMGEYSLLFQICLLIGTFMVSNVFFSIVKRLFEFRISCRAAYAVQNAVYHRVFQLPENFFKRYDSADLANRLQSTESLVSDIVNTLLTTGFSAVFSLVYLFRMISYSGKLSAAGILMVLVYAGAVYLLNSRSLFYEKQIMETEGVSASRLFQYISGVDKIRIAGMEERFILEYLKPFSEKQLYAIRKNRITSVCEILVQSASFIFSMILYFIIVRKNINVSTGAFIGFNTAFGTLASAMLKLTEGIMTIRRLKPCYERLQPVLETIPETEEEKEIVTEISGSIKLDNVTFSYSAGGKAVLNQISLKIESGEYIGIVGPSGCGKSTLMKILIGAEKPDSGKVYYDNKDLNELDKHSLRRKLGIVLQEGKLIAGSIYENITITAPKVSRKEVNDVIEAVGLKEDINAMPMKLNTILDESSGTVSGGQQQRILIARAIMNHPSILFFDEATSALDNLTQAKVSSHLDKMHITRVVIAHRLSTIKNCNRIIVLNEGTIAEEGDYQSLMAKQGLFYQMASRQLTE